MKKCNVAEFVGVIADGGAETLIKDYALMLDRDKFNVMIIVRRRTSDCANDKILAENAVRILSIYESSSFPVKVLQKLNDWWYVPYKLRKILRREAVDVLHIHLSLLHYIRKISKSIKNVRLFYTCHNEPYLFFDGKNRSEYRAACHLLKENHLQLIALHNDMQKEINRMFGIDNTVVIRNGIDFKRFQCVSETREQMRNLLGISQRAFVIGHVGRFSEGKNHHFLVDVFAELCRREENVFLLMVGAGNLKAQIEKRLDSLDLKGKYLILSHRCDIPQLMKAMDVFVFPSLYEGLPIVLIEAQVSGLRCIVSDSVNEESFQTKLVIPMSLESPPGQWCDAILDATLRGTSHGDINNYDMNQEIKRLEKLYLGELND